MERHIVSEEEKENMQDLRRDGMTCRQIAQLMGISKTTVSNYTRDVVPQIRKKKDERLDAPAAAKPQYPRDTLYDVKIYLVRKRPDLRIHVRLDHRPTYRDMMDICTQYGLRPVDFEDDRGTKIDDRMYHGTVYMSQSRNFPLARFTICRLRGEVYLEDFFR